MSSITLSLSGSSSDLSASYYPPIELGSDEYVCGLIDFTTYMSIPNITETNNTFCFLDESIIKLPISQRMKVERRMADLRMNPDKSFNEIEIIEDDSEENHFFVKTVSDAQIQLETGSYEIEDILKNLKLKIAENFPGVTFESNIEKNILKCMVKMNRRICFDRPNSIASILGFKNSVLPKDVNNYSERLVNINPINVIRVETNITTGSFANDSMNRGIYDFYPTVGIGYKILERPKTIIYLPVSERSISQFRVRIVDQDNNLIDFRGEQISLRVHIKKI